MRATFCRSLLVAAAVALTACCLTGCDDAESCGCGDDAELSGRVFDAMTDNGLNQVGITVDGVLQYTAADGGFLFENIEPGTVEVEVGTDGYYTYETQVELEEGDEVERDFPLVPESNTWEYRIIVWWGENPADLDAHLWVPTGARSTHVYSGQPGSLTEQPYAALVLNDVTGFGPEIVTIRPNNPGGWPVTYYPGEFTVAVRHNAGTSSIPESGARVEIYHEDDLIQTIAAPAGAAQQGWYWHVGTLNCETGTWTSVNSYSADPPRSNG